MDIAAYAYASNAYGLIASVTLNGTMLTRSRPTLVSPFGQPPAVCLRSHQSLRFTATNTWESYRDVLTEKKNKIGTAIVSDYDYIVNKDGQRTKVTMSGAVFTGTPWWGLAYNTTGEIESAKHSVTTGYNRAYDQDGLGNWDKSSEGATDPVSNPFTTGVVTDYTADSINQYDSIKVGSAAAVTPVHDDDGNLTDDASTYTFEWNAENQLLKVRNRSTTALIATYTYDYLGRRVRKVTSSLDIVYVYEGWNLIAEYDNSGDDPALDRTYVWGLDLSLSIHGAGGVGGLLRVTDHTVSPIKHYYPFYDGNGNVSEYILNGATNAAIHFEYDAFGNVLNGPTGQDDLEFAIQFSTKLVDEETGLSYYGFRYYDPETGRWLSRDPIGEEGGLNLYGFVGNDPTSHIDVLGLESLKPCAFEIVGGHANKIDEEEKKFNKKKNTRCDRFFGASCFRSPNGGLVWATPEARDEHGQADDSTMDELLKQKIEEAENAAEKECKNTKTCCSKITVDVSCQLSLEMSRAQRLDPLVKKACNYNNTIKCLRPSRNGTPRDGVWSMSKLKARLE